jgi:hypothetical protein
MQKHSHKIRAPRRGSRPGGMNALTGPKSKQTTPFVRWRGASAARMNAPRDWPERKKQTTQHSCGPARRKSLPWMNARDWLKRKKRPLKIHCAPARRKSALDECTA